MSTEWQTIPVAMVSSCCVSENHLGAFYNEDLRAGPSPRGADLLGPGN